MRRFLAQWLVTALALEAAVHVVSGVHVQSGGTLVLASLVLGLVNAVIRPILTILTLPVTILTLGLFYLVVNGVAFGLAAWLVPGFTVASFGSAVWAALVVSIVSWLASWLFGLRERPAGERLE